MGKDTGRKKRLEDQKKALTDSVDVISKTKQTAQNNIKELKEACVSLDKSEDLIKKKLQIVNACYDYIDTLNDTAWQEYEQDINQDFTDLGSFNALYKEVNESASFATGINLSAGSLMTSTTSGTASVGNIFHSLDNPLVKERISSIQIESTVIQDMSFIKSSLTKLSPNISSEFNTFVTNWSSAEDFQAKADLFFNLRSLIFDKFIDYVCPNQLISEASWYERTGSQRFKQAKFFILGKTGASGLQESLLLQVDSIANKIHQGYESMCKFGKHGENSFLVEVEFNKFISGFSEALRLRENLLKN